MEREVTQQEVQIIAQRSLTALSDNRVMFSADAVETLADLKGILRQLMSNQIMLVPVPTPPAAKSEDE